jgi:hypothetical protein
LFDDMVAAVASVGARDRIGRRALVIVARCWLGRAFVGTIDSADEQAPGASHQDEYEQKRSIPDHEQPVPL